MYPARYFAPRYFAPRYFPKVGASSTGGGYFPCRYFSQRYYTSSYFEHDPCQVVPPGAGGGYFPDYWPCNYFAARYFPTNPCPPFTPTPPTPIPESSGASSGHPWPNRLINLLFNKRRLLEDDEEFLLIIE